MNNTKVLSATQISRRYQEAGQTLEILNQLDFNVEKGQRLAIVGSSGSGKSTLLNILGGLEKPDTGDVTLLGDSLYAVSENRRCRIRNEKLGFVYQFHHLLHEFSALENIAMPLLIRGESVTVASDAASLLLQQVGLSHRGSHKPGQLSGGERQRVAIARALVTHPACVLMDEPTGNLDRHTAEEVQSYLDYLNQALGIAFVVVTHDLNLAARMDQVFVLEDGRLVQQAGS
ncbi:lipoprotein ABC transporter ATP-binding protein [Nitrincola sp. A-D6]|uniref:ABC transporter ATP-binding protein n=1 Tax=Nitrincola sp. A-D6 TaxID=1545442 RepID=UPI00051F86FD|nr:ATP-binding cassette domain-containing protein [Nitrincola sp. A-D6]KGK43162.1 lipoprotein ABC transporter ATP-binding protein [Nitrincola sp. A-D6]